MRRSIRAIVLAVLLAALSLPAASSPVTRAAAPRLVVFEGFYLPT